MEELKNIGGNQLGYANVCGLREFKDGGSTISISRLWDDVFQSVHWEVASEVNNQTGQFIRGLWKG